MPDAEPTTAACSSCDSSGSYCAYQRATVQEPCCERCAHESIPLDDVASALDFLLREFARRSAAAGEKAGGADTHEAAALRGKRVAYREAAEAIQHVMDGARIRRRWQRIHEAAQEATS